MKKPKMVLLERVPVTNAERAALEYCARHHPYCGQKMEAFFKELEALWWRSEADEGYRMLTRGRDGVWRQWRSQIARGLSQEASPNVLPQFVDR